MGLVKSISSASVKQALRTMDLCNVAKEVIVLSRILNSA